MALEINIGHIKTIVSNTSFETDGDFVEKKCDPRIKEKFPKCEEFWRNFVVPMTYRIDPNISQTNTVRIRRRPEVDSGLYEIAIFHYSAFIKIVYGFNHLNNITASSFEEYYAHLASCCDIVEDFLLKIHLISNECLQIESETFQKLSKRKFLDLAGDFYDNNYHKAFQYYLEKGKFMSMPLPGRENLLDEYFGRSQDWKEYKTFTSKIRQYRNVLVHSSIVGKIFATNVDIVLVPKKETVAKYKKLADVLDSANHMDRLKHDFIDMRQLMHDDMNTLLQILNKMWDKPINDLTNLLYTTENKTLWSKYGIIIR